MFVIEFNPNEYYYLDKEFIWNTRCNDIKFATRINKYVADCIIKHGLERTLGIRTYGRPITYRLIKVD